MVLFPPPTVVAVFGVIGTALNVTMMGSGGNAVTPVPTGTRTTLDVVPPALVAVNVKSVVPVIGVSIAFEPVRTVGVPPTLEAMTLELVTRGVNVNAVNGPLLGKVICQEILGLMLPVAVG